MRPLRFFLVACVLLEFARADSDKTDKLIHEDADDDTSDDVKLSEEDVVAPTEDSEPLQQKQKDDTAEWESPIEAQRELVTEELEEAILPSTPDEEEEYAESFNARLSENVDSRDDQAFEAYDEVSQRRLALEDGSDSQYDELRGSYDEASAEGDSRSNDESSGTEETFAYDEEDEEEALPLIPGLTDVDLVAFNAEYANEEVLDKIIDWSYDQVAAQSAHRDTYIHVEDLYDFLLKTLNPLDEEIDAEDEEILRNAVTELRQQQGLVDDSMILYRGFIARGMPLRFLQNLAHEMHHTVQSRRLRATAGEL